MNKSKVFFIGIFVACIGSLASDIYTPSLPFVAKDLAASIHMVQYSMAIFMIAMAVSQLMYGPLSEGVGRKIPLIVGVVIFLVGSYVAMTAATIRILLIGRCIQGLGAGAGPLFRSIFRDIFAGDLLAKYGSYAMVIVTLVIPMAPMLGGLLQTYIGWRANFGFLLLYATVMLLFLLFAMPETNRYIDKNRLRVSYILKTYRFMLKNRVFMGYSLCCFISYGAFFAWFTTGPILLIHVLGMSPSKFGSVSLCMGVVAMGSAGILNGKLVTKLSAGFMLQLGWSLMGMAGLSMLLLYLMIGMNTYMLIIPMTVLYFGASFIWPNIFALAFTPFADIAGYAGALYACIQIAGGAACGALMGYLPDHNCIPLALVFIFSPLLAWLVYKRVVIGKVQ